jgi:hypothetical protein
VPGSFVVGSTGKEVEGVPFEFTPATSAPDFNSNSDGSLSEAAAQNDQCTVGDPVDVRRGESPMAYIRRRIAEIVSVTRRDVRPP